MPLEMGAFLKGNWMERLSKEEAEALIEEWADAVELDTDRQLYTDIKEELRMPVKLQKLSFEPETEIFSLVLKAKIKDKDKEICIVEIKSCDMAAKRVLQSYKENESIDQARAMIGAYTGLKEAQIKQLKDLDINRINAIILGFIMQVDPGKKS